VKVRSIYRIETLHPRPPLLLRLNPVQERLLPTHPVSRLLQQLHRQIIFLLKSENICIQVWAPCTVRVIFLSTNRLIVEWQKYYDDALAQAKSPNADVILLGSQSVGQGQQGWSNVGGKSAKGGNPWGTQNRNSPLFRSRCN
jgi:hypothetical protein